MLPILGKKTLLKLAPKFNEASHYEKLEDLVAAAADDLPSVLSAAVPLIMEHGPKILDKLIGWFTNKTPSPVLSTSIPDKIMDSGSTRNIKGDLGP